MSPSQDPAELRGAESQPALDAIFAPRTVAVIGATEKTGSVGRALLWNLITNPFGGTVYPINPNRPSVLGIPSHPRIGNVPEPIDLAVVATPAPTVPTIIAECVDAKVKGAIIISAGFKEVGPDGARLEQLVLTEARRGRMRIIGPNCLGLMRPHQGLNATFAGQSARPGTVGFLSQSGALCTAILDWSLRVNVGFSAFVSIGSMLDVGWGDLIDYLGDDPLTKCILIYMESIGDARWFLSAAREVALSKPIIVIKAGRTEPAARAATSHTGALTGSDEVLDAAFRRAGVLRVNSVSEVFNMAEVLANQPKPRGRKLAIITNAGGPGILATDTLIENHGELAVLSPMTLDALDQMLPTAWSHGNPIDLLGDADAQRYAQTLQVTTQDPNIDGFLTILTPQAMSNPTETAKALTPFARVAGKPMLASWMGGTSIEAGVQILNDAGIPTFPYPDIAAHTFVSMWRLQDNLQALYETPALASSGVTTPADHTQASLIIDSIRKDGRAILTEVESKQVLASYGIPTITTQVAETEDTAITAARAIGFPVVLKLHSQTITHKTDVGGVRLRLVSDGDVRAAFRGIQASVTERAGAEHFHGVTVQPMVQTGGYELIIGSSVDPQFGPVLLFGAGGPLVEVVQDRALGLPPLNTTLARRMMERTKIFTALQGVRGQSPVDLAALERLLVQFSDLVVEQRWIKEIDINPLLASPDRLLVLDARVIVHKANVHDREIPPLAIRPYPSQYSSTWTAKDGSPVTIRPIRPDDEPLLVQFHSTLSNRSVALRYFHAMTLSTRVAHNRLTRICFIDYDRAIALVAESTDPQTGDHRIQGVGRLTKVRGTDAAEFALLVSDQVQGQGLGTQLLQQLLQVAHHEKIQQVSGDILPENSIMRRVCDKLGFQMHYRVGDPVVRATIQP